MCWKNNRNFLKSPFAKIISLFCVFMYLSLSEEGGDCDRSCDNIDSRVDDPQSRGRRKRYVSWQTSLQMSNTVNTTRRKRDVTRPLFPSDRGPIEFTDTSGNLIQLNRDLEKPSKQKRKGSHYKDLKSIIASDGSKIMKFKNGRPLEHKDSHGLWVINNTNVF